MLIFRSRKEGLVAWPGIKGERGITEIFIKTYSNKRIIIIKFYVCAA